jgi:hypothetical protein
MQRVCSAVRQITLLINRRERALLWLEIINALPRCLAASLQNSA